jgi:isoquinoline 1-oxidoreductase beta subunit
VRPNAIAKPSRRGFLQTSMASAGLLLFGQFRLLGQANEVSLNAWIRIAADDTVTLIASQAEMGQGAGTTLPAILAEELCADWKKVRLEQCGVNAAYNNPRVNWQFTGNSESTTGFFELLRRMGASARETLIQAAAERWRVMPSECVADANFVIHSATNRRLRFGELADAAAKLKPPADPPLKQQSEWKLLGRSLGRVELPSKLNGSAVFGLDFRVPGMLYAAVAMPPAACGKVRRHDRTPAVNMPGVVDVVELPDGIAVVADTYWRARKALAAIPIEWDPGPNATLDSAEIMSQYKRALEGNEWIRVIGPEDQNGYSSDFHLGVRFRFFSCKADWRTAGTAVPGRPISTAWTCIRLSWTGGFPVRNRKVSRFELGVRKSHSEAAG